MSPVTETVLVMLAVSLACSGLGVFLVLRKLAMTADAIGHTLLLGIVLAYAVVGDLSSPWLTFGAAATGVVTVWLVEVLQRSRLIKQDAAIGLVFPALFALGTLLASIDFRQIHLDVDAVLLGQVENARLVRFQWFGVNVPRAVAVMLSIAAINWLLIAICFKELKITTFDAGLALALGFLPTIVHAVLISLTSLTAVAAFDAVGPVLVVAFFVIPAAMAKLVTTRLGWTLAVACAIGLAASGFGTWLAFQLNTNVGGTVTMLLGTGFGLVAVLQTFVLAKKNAHFNFFNSTSLN